MTDKKPQKKLWHRLRLSLLFAAVVFVILALTGVVVFGVFMLLYRWRIVDTGASHGPQLLLFATVSIIVGTIMAFFSANSLCHRCAG